MSIRKNTALRNIQASELAALFDLAEIDIRSGTRPASANDTATGTLLVTIVMADPAFGAPSDGTVSAASLPRTGTAAASGTATWARCTLSGGCVMDLAVSESAGPGTIVIDDADIVSGGLVRITALTLTVPSGE